MPSMQHACSSKTPSQPVQPQGTPTGRQVAPQGRQQLAAPAAPHVRPRARCVCLRATQELSQGAGERAHQLRSKGARTMRLGRCLLAIGGEALRVSGKAAKRGAFCAVAAEWAGYWLTVCSGPGVEHAAVRQLDSAGTAPAASRAERCANPMPARAAIHEDASICSRPSRLGSRQSTHLFTHIIVCSVRRLWRCSAVPRG